MPVPTPNTPSASPPPRTSALLWAVAAIGVLAGLGLYLANGRPASETTSTSAPEATLADASSSAILALPDAQPIPTPPANFFTLPGCRLFDASVAAGDSVLDLSAECGVPASAKILAISIAILNPERSGELGLYAADGAADGAALVKFEAGRPQNRLTYLSLPADGAQRAGVRNTSGAAVRVILDLSGYFE